MITQIARFGICCLSCLALVSTCAIAQEEVDTDDFLEANVEDANSVDLLEILPDQSRHLLCTDESAGVASDETENSEFFILALQQPQSYRHTVTFVVPTLNSEGNARHFCPRGPSGGVNYADRSPGDPDGRIASNLFPSNETRLIDSADAHCRSLCNQQNYRTLGSLLNCLENARSDIGQAGLRNRPERFSGNFNEERTAYYNSFGVNSGLQRRADESRIVLLANHPSNDFAARALRLLNRHYLLLCRDLPDVLLRTQINALQNSRDILNSIRNLTGTQLRQELESRVRTTNDRALESLLERMQTLIVARLNFNCVFPGGIEPQLVNDLQEQKIAEQNTSFQKFLEQQ